MFPLFSNKSTKQRKHVSVAFKEIYKTTETRKCWFNRITKKQHVTVSSRNFAWGVEVLLFGVIVLLYFLECSVNKYDFTL